MTLKLYVTPRLVVMTPQSTALEAARAMENNRIGAVMVVDKGRVVGMVTDRDLSIKVIGQEKDPKTTPIKDIMTSPVVTLSPKNTHEDAIKLMIETNIRRIPLIEDDRLVGIVTLDDLILDEAVPIDQVAAVVEAQVGEGGPALSARTPSRRRSAARAQATYRRLLKEVQNVTKLDEVEKAEKALHATLACIVRRLTPGEAKDLISQLPSLLQPKLKSELRGPDKDVTRTSIEENLMKELNVDKTRASEILSAVCNVIAQSISPGELEDVRSQLPRELQEVFA